MKFHTLYNPHNIPKNILIDNFVIRITEFKNIFDRIKYYTKQNSINNFHFLIQGQRGAGKSTLLLRLKYACEEENNIESVIFNEEELSIDSFDSFFFRVLELLKNDKKNFFSLNELINYLEENNKFLVLFIDNFFEILENFEDEKDVENLLELFRTNNNFKVVGAIANKSDIYYKYQDYFKNYFEHIWLKGLHFVQTIEYLSYLGNYYNKRNIKELIEKSPKKIKILRDLTDGNPRIMAMLIDIVASKTNIIEDVEKILDIVTEHYRHRIKELSKVQKTIIFEIAQSFKPIHYNKLLKLNLEKKELNLELNKLQNNDILEKIVTKKGIYFKIRERFFNIWFLMRYKKSSNDGIRWLIEFLDIWYSDEQLIKEIKIHTKEIKRSKLDLDNVLKTTEALNQIYIKRFGEDDLSDEHYLLAIDFLEQHNKIDEWKNYFSISELDYYFKKALNFYKKSKYKDALSYFKKAIKIDKTNFVLWISLASTYKKISDIKYVDSYKNGINSFNDGDAKIVSMHPLYIEALYNYILYYLKSASIENINNINIYTDIKFIEFNLDQKNIYFELIKMLLLSKNKKLVLAGIKLLKKYMEIFDTNKKIESILNILFVLEYNKELLDIFEEFEYLQDRYNVIFFALLKKMKLNDEYIIIPLELEDVLNNYMEHFHNHKKEIIELIKEQIIDSSKKYLN